MTASLLKKVCHDVEIEPRLQPLSDEHLQLATANGNPEAQLDVKARGIWGGTSSVHFFDVQIFNPCARSNQVTQIASAYRRHENIKRHQYAQRIREIEMASLVPLVFTTSGSLGPAATVTFQRIASLLADKWATPYSAIMGWLRCRLSFVLLRSYIMCLRGSRKHVRSDAAVRRPDLAVAEGQIRF